nr:MAG TPA: protein of unknown function DUF1424 [Bacteriophage sp.]
MPYFTKITDAGVTRAIVDYHDRARPEPGGKRCKKVKPSSEAQRKNNLRRSAQRLTMDLNANFDEECWYLTWNYKTELRPKDKEEMLQQVKKTLRNLRKVYKKAGLELKYVWVPEIGPRGACHIHIVVSAITINLIRHCWEYGGMYIEPLRDDRNYRKLAEYFVKYSEKTRETWGGKQAGRYNPSKNLVHPETKKHRRRKKTFSAGEIHVPEGWYLDKDSVQEWINDQGYKYLYYILVQTPERRLPKCRT